MRSDRKRMPRDVEADSPLGGRRFGMTAASRVGRAAAMASYHREPIAARSPCRRRLETRAAASSSPHPAFFRQTRKP